MAAYIPAALIALRIALGPLLVWDALDGTVSPWFIPGFLLAFFSDVFDGIIARRLGVSSPQLREADSWADIVLYGCVFACVWLAYPHVLRAFRWPLGALIASQLVSMGVDWAKYGRLASYHAWSAKAWGITLCMATVALFGFGHAGWALWLMIAMGIANNAECVAMTFLLPSWTHDVKSIVHAWRLRGQEDPHADQRKARSD